MHDESCFLMIFQTRIHNLTDWIFWLKPRFYWFCRGRLKCNDQNVWDFELRQRREASVCRHRCRCGRPPGNLLPGSGQHQTLATIIWWVLHRSAVVCFMVAALVKYFQEQQCNCRLNGCLRGTGGWTCLTLWRPRTSGRGMGIGIRSVMLSELSLLILLIIYHHFS